MRDLLFRLRTKSSLVPKMLKSVRICASSSSQCSLSDSKRSIRPQLWMKWPRARSTSSVVLHVGDPVIFRERRLQLRLQRVIGRIADAQHRRARFLQPVAEFGAIAWKMRRKENKIHGRHPLAQDAALRVSKSGAFAAIEEVARPRKSGRESPGRESLGRESPGDRDAGQQPAAAVMHSHTGVSKNSHGCNRPATSAMKGAGVRSSHRGDSHEQDFA